MKNKILALILIISSFCFSFVGCNSVDSDDSSESRFEYEPSVDLVEPFESLKQTLIKYLQQIYAEYNLIAPSFEKQINKIKNGAKALRVTFDPNNYYYVCAYFNDSCEYEKHLYCCVEKYEWIKFDKETEIKEVYGGKEFIVAFQINKTVVCENILRPEKTDNIVEHYQLYKPEFSEGINIASAIDFDTSFVHIEISNKKTLYLSVEFYEHKLTSFRARIIEGECYYYSQLYFMSADGVKSECDLTRDFGEYYDELMDVMIEDQYSEQMENGTTVHYGLFLLGDIVNLIKNNEF